MFACVRASVPVSMSVCLRGWVRHAADPLPSLQDTPATVGVLQVDTGLAVRLQVARLHRHPGDLK